MRKKLVEYARHNRILAYFASLLAFVFLRSEWLNDFNTCLCHYEMNNLSKEQKNKLAIDVLGSRIKNRVTVDEYFRYEFYNLSEIGRRQYVSDRELIMTLRKQDDPESFVTLRYKDKAYEKFKEYYKRDCVKIESAEDFSIFADFCNRHKTFIVKPLSGSFGGKGVRKETVSDQKSVRKVFDSYINSNNSFLLEELIEQHTKMAVFHPQSVNTIRLVTCNTGDEIEIVQSSVRIGIGDSIVDNGCLSSSVDLETGVITSPGRCAHRKGLYSFHPDTGVQIIGSKIPQWEDLKEQIVTMAKVLPKQRVIGWDMALSTRGWVMIEGNTQPAIQTLSGVGVGARDLLNYLKIN